jgi:hypothetical protein
LLDQARLAGVIGAVAVEIAAEAFGERIVLVEHRTIAAQKAQHVGTEQPIVLRHQMAVLETGIRRAQRDLRLRVAAEQFVELDEAVDEIERQLGAEDALFLAADPGVTLENGQSRLLNGQRDDLADIRQLLGVLIADRGEPAEADVLKLMDACPHAHARRALRKQLSRLIARRPIPNFSAAGALELLIREHTLAPTPIARRPPPQDLCATRDA